MIKPKPVDLPPQAQQEARALTDDVEFVTKRIADYNSDVTVKFRQSNSQLQFLSEQVRVLQQYVNSLPGSTGVYQTVVNNIAPGTGWSDVASLTITLPGGYTRMEVFALGIARIVDTTAPYITGGQSRFLVNGVANTAINQRYPWNGVPPENLANSSVSTSVNGNVTLTFQCIEDQTVQPAGYSWAQISAFAVFY